MGQPAIQNSIRSRIVIKRYCFFIFLIIPLILSSCSKNDNDYSIATQVDLNLCKNAYGLRVRTPNGKEVFPFLVSDSAIHFVLPDSILSNLSFLNTDKEVFIDGEKYCGQVVNLSDFINPHILSIVDNHITHKWTILVYNLPVLQVNTISGQDITSKEQRVESSLILYYTDGRIDTLGLAGIRGRGNSTWQKPKKPYNVKLEKKHAVLGMNNSENWILLSNPYYDLTQLHNATALEISKVTEMPWTPSGKFVELILNNTHKGLYFLCEKIGVEKNKINIREMQQTDTAGVELTGGYLLESYVQLITDSASKDTDAAYFQTNYVKETGFQWARCNLLWEIKEPDNIHHLQKDYVINALNHLESLLFNQDSLSSSSYCNYLDIDSAIDWLLVEEVCGNMEAGKAKNMYLYKDVDDNTVLGGGRFCVGPSWDFDAYSFGTFQRGHGFLIKDNAFYFPLLFKDPVFVNRVKERWSNYKDKWKEDIPKFIEQQYNMIRKSALRNEFMWKDWLPNDYFSNYDESVRYMLAWYNDHVEWLDGQINGFE